MSRDSDKSSRQVAGRILEFNRIRPVDRGAGLSQRTITQRPPGRLRLLRNRKYRVSAHPERIEYRDLSLSRIGYACFVVIPPSLAAVALVAPATAEFPEVLAIPLSFAFAFWFLGLLALVPGGLHLTIDGELISYRFGRSDRVTRPITEISHGELVYWQASSEGGSGTTVRVCFTDGTTFAHHDDESILRSIHWFRPDLEVRLGQDRGPWWRRSVGIDR